MMFEGRNTAALSRKYARDMLERDVQQQHGPIRNIDEIPDDDLRALLYDHQYLRLQPPPKGQ